MGEEELQGAGTDDSRSREMKQWLEESMKSRKICLCLCV